MAFESAHIYRDTLFSLGIILVVVLVVAWFQNANRKPLSWHVRVAIMLLATIWLTSLLREQFLWVFALLVFGLAAVIWRAPIPLRLGAFSVAIVFLVATLVILGHRDSLHTSVNQLWAATDYDHSTYVEQLGAYSDGIGSRIFRLPFFVSIPFRLGYASLNPLPTMAGSLSDKYHHLGTVFWFLCLPFLARGCMRAFTVAESNARISYRGVATSFLFFYCVVALTTLQDRQFTMYIPMASVLIVTEMQRKNQSPGKPVLFMATLGAVLCAIYVGIKWL